MHQHGTDPSGIRISELKEAEVGKHNDYLVINKGDINTQKIRVSDFVNSINTLYGNYVISVNEKLGPYVTLTAGDVNAYTKEEIDAMLSAFGDFNQLHVINSATPEGNGRLVWNAPHSTLMYVPPDLSEFALKSEVLSSQTNLQWISYSFKGEILSSTGTGTDVPAVTDSQAGLMLPGDKIKLDSIESVVGTTNLTWEAFATHGTVYSDTGTDATLTLATTELAGLMGPADKVRLDLFDPADLVQVLNDLDDVVISGQPQVSNILTYNGSFWVNSASPPADISGSSINNLNDVDASDAQDNDNLYWDQAAGNWKAAHKLQDLWDFAGLTELV